MTSELPGGIQAGALTAPPRNTERYGKPTHRFESMAEFLAHREFKPSIVQIAHSESLIEFLILPGETGTPLIVNYHAALSGHAYSLPYFTGLNITKGIRATQVCLSDPTLLLDADLKLAWYAGHRALPLQKVWPLVLDHLVECFHASREIHFGASGGGFAALYYAHNRPHAMAIPVNPQTSLQNYLTSSVKNYLRIAWGISEELDVETGLSRIDAVHDVNELYGNGHSNTVVYIQNVQDDHVVQHLVPFLEATHSPNNPESIFVHLHRWGEGHVPPTADFLQIVLRTLARSNWEQTLREGKYLAHPDPAKVRKAVPSATGQLSHKSSQDGPASPSIKKQPRPYGLSHFTQDLRYGRREINEQNKDFTRFAEVLESEFSNAISPLSPEARSRYPEYIDFLRYTRGLDEAVRSAYQHLERGIHAPLVAVSVQQTCKRAGDFERAVTELSSLHLAYSDNPYIALLYGQSLQATASWTALQELGRSVLTMSSLSSQPTMAARWARLLLDSAYPDLARRFIDVLPDSALEKASLGYRASLYNGPTTIPREIQTFVINLQQDGRKRRVTTGALGRAGHSCHILRAVDARDLPDYALHSGCSNPQVVRSIGAGAVGCALSHIKVWEHIAEHCPDGAFVVEDDAAPYTDISRAWDVMSSVGDLDMLFVNERMSSVYGDAAPAALTKPTLDPWAQIGGWKPGRTGWGFDGYFISASGSEKLLSIMERERIQGHIDGQVGAYGLRNDKAPSNAPQRTFLEFRRQISDSEQLRTLSMVYPATAQNNFGFSTIGTITRDRETGQ